MTLWQGNQNAFAPERQNLAGLSCKRNTDEEPDISQLIEEKTPTRSSTSHDSHMGSGTAGSAVNARGPNSGAFACALWIAA
jgi:hypothetical protein